MATIGGGATTSTGRVENHAVRAPASGARGNQGRNRIAGAATVSTSSPADAVQRVGGPSYGGAGTKNPIGGGTTSTGRVGRHVARAPDGRSGPGSPSGKSGGYPTPGRGGRGSGK